jgi:hypothetical protein
MRSAFRMLLLITALVPASSFDAIWATESGKVWTVPCVSTGNPFGGPIRPRRRMKGLCFVSETRYCAVSHWETRDTSCRCYVNGHWKKGRMR